MSFVRAGGAVLLVTVLGAQHVEAADSDAASSSTADEVIVNGQHPSDVATSATKSALSIIETPQSVSVIDRQDLDDRVVKDLNEAVHFTAGMGPDTRGNTAGRYDLQTLRGFIPDQYLDGLRVIGSTNGYATPQIDLGFLERLEILKGPASGLYGQGSPGGIVALTSKLPTVERTSEFYVSGGSFGTVRALADVGGRIDQDGQFLFRLVGLAEHSDTQTNFVESERLGISPSFTWRPDDQTTWTLIYNFQHDPKPGDYGAMPVQGTLLPNPNGTIPRDFYDGENSYEQFDRTQNLGTSLFTRRFGNWTFRQNTRFMSTGTHYRSVYHLGFDTDLIHLFRSVALADEIVDGLTLDNQLAGIVNTGPLTHNIVAGVDYQKTHQTEAAGFGGAASELDAFNPVYGLPVTPPDITFNVRLNLHQTGVYVQDQIALDNFRLTVSGRQDWVKSEQLDRIGGSTTAFSQNKFTGRAGLLYLFPNGLAPYFSYATSFLPQTAVDRDGHVLPPTLGRQSELGIKYQPALWNTLLTAAVYDLHQTNVATQDPTVPSGFGSIAAGEVRSRGIELEGSARPTPALTTKASYTYLDNKVVKDNTGLVGTRPYAVPQQTANAYAIYTLQDGPAAGLGVGGAVRYLGKQFNGVAAPGNLTIPGATLFDLLGKYDFGKLNASAEGLTFNLDVTNLLDKRYVGSCYANLWCWYGASRSVQASLKYKM